MDPLEANNWLRVTESKFGLLHYSKLQKTLFAAQQLRGSTSAWWDSYTTTLPKDHWIPWNEFRTTFCAHHLPVGLLRRKLKEVRDLKQGNHTVYDYTRKFNILAQYGTYHVNTDEKKDNLYREGLTIHRQDRLVQFSILSYDDLVSAAIDQERLMKAVAEADEKKRKRMKPGSSSSGGSSGAPPKYHMVYTPPEGQLHQPQQQQYWGNCPQYQQ
jgi:hypothetical protein